MSDIFKSNSRFSALLENSPPQKREKNYIDQKDKDNNSFIKKGNEEYKFSSFRPLDENEKERRRLKREMEIQQQKAFEEREKEKIISKSLQRNPTNFPELSLDSKQDNITNKCESYIEKLKHQSVSNNDVDADLVDLKPGWFILKRDKLTGKTIIKKTQVKNVVSNVVEEKKKVNIDITESLIKLHDKRTQEYIDNYGYDQWEKIFKVPNWREEEAYLEMMEEALCVCDNLIDSDYQDEYGDEFITIMTATN
jgi:hypothetical protein